MVLGFSAMCFGMDKQETWKILNVTHPDFYSDVYAGSMSGKLQIYGEDSMPLKAQFIPHQGLIIKFSNFDVISDERKQVFIDNKFVNNLRIPVSIYAPHSGHSQTIMVTHVEELNKPQDLAKIIEFQLTVHADSIELYKQNSQSPIIVRHADNIAKMHALYSGKLFMIDFMENGRVIQGQVKKYSNGYALQLSNLRSSFQWEGFRPSCDWNCITMPVHLEDTSKPQMIALDLDKEEKPQSYQISKWMGGGLVVMVLAALIYKLKDKMHVFDDALSQFTKMITNTENLSIIE